MGCYYRSNWKTADDGYCHRDFESGVMVAAPVGTVGIGIFKKFTAVIPKSG